MLRTLSDPDDEWGRPFGLAVAPSVDMLYVSDERHGVVRSLGADGRSTVVAKGLRSPQGLAVAPDGRLLVCESAVGRISAVDPATGTSSPVWENVPLVSGIATNDTEVFAVSAGRHCVLARELRMADTPRVVAGTPGSSGNMKSGRCGDGGPATSAQLNSPSDLALSPDGEVLIVDSYNGRVRMVSADGTLRTIAGADQSRPRGNRGRATEINIGQTRGVAWAPGGPLVTAMPSVLWQLQGDEMVPLAGTWVDGNNGDEGEALEMRLSTPCGVALWGDKIAVADSGNRRVCLVDLT